MVRHNVRDVQDLSWDGVDFRVLRNVARLNIVYGNNNRVIRGLQSFVCREAVVRWDKIHYPYGCVDKL